MKKIKRLFSILMMSLVALFVFAGTNKAKAASTTNEGLNVEYKIYKESDFDNFMTNFEETYGASLVNILCDLAIVDNYNYGWIIEGLGAGTQEELEEMWDDETLLGKGNLMSYSDALAARDALFNLQETTTFTPGEVIVIVPYVTIYNSSSVNIGMFSVDLYFNFKPKSGNTWDYTNSSPMFESAEFYDAENFYSKSKRLNEGRFFFPLALQVRVCVFSSK